MNETMTERDKNIIRKLCYENMELANKDAMKQKQRLWYDHNRGYSQTPLVFVEHETFLPEVVTKLDCETPLGREVEARLKSNMATALDFGDDRVVPDFYTVNIPVEFKLFDLDIGMKKAKDQRGMELGYQHYHPIKRISDHIDNLSPSSMKADRKWAEDYALVLSDIIGDIMPVRLGNAANDWVFCLTALIIPLMGMGNYFIAFYDEPENLHRLLRRIVTELYNFFEWQSKNGLIFLNNANNYAGSGSLGFSDELPSEGFDPENIRMRDIWINMNSQESTGLSPEAYGEFLFPYFKELAAEAGLVYYGCCEAIDSFWEYVSRYPNLRKVSVSPWADEERMGEYLRGSNIIYARKPSPNYLGITRELDEDGFREHIKRTAIAARGCELEISFRDIYTVGSNLKKVRKAVDITRETLEKYWYR